MNQKKLHGTGVALVTPFNEDESIDFDGLKRLMNTTAQKGVDYYVVQGTTGESVTTTQAEKQAILNFILENNSHGLPIVYGIGGNNTAQVIETIKNTSLDGVDAILSVSPYYNKPTQKGIIAHFEKIADNSPLPIILYNVPGRTSSNLTAETTLELAKHQNIIGIKEASGDVTQANEITTSAPDDFLIISGDDMLTPKLYEVGAVGVISVLANGFADLFKEMRENVSAGEYQNAQAVADSMSELNDLMYIESNPVGIKYVLKSQNVCNDVVRLPLLRASEKLQKAINEALNSI